MKNKLLIFENEKNLNRTIYLLILIMVISGIFGFIYETIFYKIDLGYYVKRGSTFGPWIPIYAFGGLFITLLTYKHKKNPLIVFLLSAIITAALEYLTGYILYEFFNTRLWDYNTEIWNFGNINGYICLRSILFFCLSNLLLIYLIIPILIKITDKLQNKTLKTISLTLGILFALDIVMYNILK